MKKLFLICLTLCISFIAVSQEKTKQREVGLVFNSLNNFGLTFKCGTKKSLWRFNTLFISGSQAENKNSSYISKGNTLGIGLRFGNEFRKVIVKNLEFRFGADLSFTYTHSKFHQEQADNSGIVYFGPIEKESSIYQPGINLVLGFNYVIADKFVLGAEILPSFKYMTGSTDDYTIEDGSVYPIQVKGDVSGFNYGISTSSVLLSLAYRF